MNKAVKQALAAILQTVGKPACVAGLYFMKLAGIGARGPLIARAGGVIAMRDHYYSCIPSERDVVAPGFWDRQSALPGIDLREDAAISYLKTTIPAHLAQFRAAFPHIVAPDTSRDGEFHLVNGTYMAVDAHMYFSYILDLKPKRIVEVGSGNSTLVALAAIRLLRQQGHETSLACIEPFAHGYLKTLAAKGELTLIEKRIQEVELSLFTGLAENDILFIDSTHVLREGSDVQYEFLEILPRLNPGVSVHVHDISLPRRYPKVYFDTGKYWNEQYLLQAYLINNAKVQVTWPGSYMMQKHPALMHATFPEIAMMRQTYPSSEPTAFWFRTVA